MRALPRRTLLTGAVAGAAAQLFGTTASAHGRRLGVYLGSFSPDAGVQRGTVDPRTGVLTVGATVPDLPDSSWFAHSADRRIVYVTNELPEGHVSAVDAATGRVLNKQSTHGEAPTHLSVHGQFLLTANYGSGSVVVHRLAGDGTIGESTDLVTHTGAAEAHAHQVLPDPSGRWVVAVDLGTDSVYVYGLDPASGKLRARQQLRLPTGYGPRHLAFHPDGRRAYILGELRSEITVAAWDPSAGLFTPGQVIGTLGDATPPQNFPSEIQVSPDGRFVYAANRGHDSIATFDVRGERLAFAGTTPCGGAWPRHFTLDPTGRWVYVANQRANAVSWLLRDPRTGRLGSPAGSAAVNSACFVLFGRNAR